MMKNLFSFFFLFSFLSNTYAQSIQEKYWIYRARAVSDYFRLGEGPGACVAAISRSLGGKRIVFSDATIDTGWYMGVLATELALLKQNKKDTQYVLGEIACVLKAMNRLGLAHSGYFIRDDVTLVDAKRFPGVDEVWSDFLHQNSWAKEMSQDQVAGVFLGYRLLKEYLEADDQSQGLSLRDEVKRQVKTIYEHIQGVNSKKWRIYKENGEIVKRGADARGFSAPFEMIAEDIIYDGKYGKQSAKSFSKPAFRLILRSAHFPYQFYVRAMVLTLGSISNIWKKKTSKILSRMDKKHHLELYPFLHAVLFDKKIKELNKKKPRLSQEKIEKILIDAPVQGPNHNDKNFWRWNNRFYSSDRLRDPNYVRLDGDAYHDHDAVFLGHDYMLMYNLYLLYFKPAELKSYEASADYIQANQASYNY